jgi:DNA-binding NarL/FixJ family response regulator
MVSFGSVGRGATIADMTDPDQPAPPDERLRVLVIDADDRVRESLAGLLAIGDRVVVVGTAGHPGRAMELLASMRPDVVLVDPRLPDVDAGTALIAQLRKASPGVRVLAMSWSDRLEQGRIDCGADGLVRKTFRPAELLAAILDAGRPALA